MPLGLESLPFHVMGWGIEIIVEWSKYINALPASNIKVPAISGVALGFITVGGLWLCFWRMQVRLLGIPIILIGIIWSFIDINFPDIVVDKKGKLFALRSASGEYIFSDRKFARYSRDIWARMLGQSGKFTTLADIKKSKYLQELMHGDDVSITCREGGCEYYKYGQKLYILWGGGDVQKNCEEFDLVVSLRAENIPCKKDPSRFVSTSDLAAGGTHLFTLLPRQINIRTVESERGSRPWN
jgi:competence protein ComEC